MSVLYIAIFIYFIGIAGWIGYHLHSDESKAAAIKVEEPPKESPKESSKESPKEPHVIVVQQPQYVYTDGYPYGYPYGYSYGYPYGGWSGYRGGHGWHGGGGHGGGGHGGGGHGGHGGGHGR